MKTLSEYIKDYRKKYKVTQQELADRSGLSKGFISQIENDYRTSKDNKRMMPSLDTLKALASGMNIELNEFLSSVDTDFSIDDEKRSKASNFHRIPLYSTICCGNGGFVDDEIMDYISLPPEKLNPHKEYFAQVASGNSMINAGIHPGDILVFEKTSSVDDGDIGCFCIDDNEAMCKRYRLKKDKDGHIVQIVLVPDNPDVVKYPPVVIDVETQHFRTIGKLVYCIMDMKGR